MDGDNQNTKYLKLSVEGGAFSFRAREYSIEADMLDEWCLVDIKARIESVYDHADTTGSRVSSNIDLCIENDESLMCAELRRLEETIDDALAGKLAESVTISPMEPYMEFVISPVTPGDGFPMPNIQWRLFVWYDGAPTEQYVSLCFMDDDMEKISLYLKYLRGDIGEDDERLEGYLTDGY